MSRKIKKEIKPYELVTFFEKYPCASLKQLKEYFLIRSPSLLPQLNELQKLKIIDYSDKHEMYFLLGYHPTIQEIITVNKTLPVINCLKDELVVEDDYYVNFPYNIIFFAGGQEYNIIYIAEGDEKKYCFAINNRQNQPTAKNIVVVEKEKQLNNINISNTFCYCLVNEEEIEFLEGDINE